MRFTKEHEWIKKEGDLYLVGVTQHAIELLGDLVYIELPAPGEVFDKDTECAVVESVKAASDVYCPVSGMVTEINVSLEDTPEAVSDDWTTWIFKLENVNEADLEDFMDEEAYNKYIEGL